MVLQGHLDTRDCITAIHHCLPAYITTVERLDWCCYLKKFVWKGTLRQVFYLSKAHSPPMTPYPPPLHTVSEPVFLNVYGAPELIPRNEFRQPM